MEYFSQTRQDYIVDLLLGKKNNGTFFDIGAHNGIKFSNSYFFEKYRGWKGVCVEPIPEIYAELQKNRKCKLINGAISEKEGTLEFTRVHGYLEMLSGLSKFRDIKHVERTKRELTEHGGNVEVIQVQCHTLESIFKSEGISKIDYLSIDIEGGELEVLKTINMRKANITVLTVENNYQDPKIKALMASQGYHRVFIEGADEFYIKKAFSLTFLFRVFTNKSLMGLFYRSQKAFRRR